MWDELSWTRAAARRAWILAPSLLVITCLLYTSDAADEL